MCLSLFISLCPFFQTPEKKKSADKQNGSPDKKAGTSGKPKTQVNYDL